MNKEYFLKKSIEYSTVFVKSNAFIFCVLSIIPIHSVLTHFDFQNQTITTLNNLYYDFSSSWRLHVSRLLDNEKLYTDFYYPYPPLGLYIISIFFNFTGENIFHQSLFTALVALSIHVILFLILRDITKSRGFIFLGLFISFCCLNFSYRHEIYLGGNPFPLIFGFLFFLVGILLLLKKFNIHLLFFILACSFKHEFWLPTIFIIFCNFRNYKIVDYILTSVILLLNLVLGYNSFDIISGMGRSDWARWQFHWEVGIVHLILSIPLLLIFRYKKSAYIVLFCFFILCLNNEFNIVDYSIIFNSRVGKSIYNVHNSLNFGNLCNYTFLIGLLIITYKEKDRNILIFLVLITLLQCRRLFEWSEMTYNSLIPIGFIYAYINTNIPKLKSLYRLCIIKILTISCLSYLIHSYKVHSLLYDSSKISVANTHSGKIRTVINVERFHEIQSIINNKNISCFPFHSGMSLLTGANLSSPVNYYYSRNRIKTFDYYKNRIKLDKPDYYIIDNDFTNWNSYPELQFSMFKWKLDRERIDLLKSYPEIINIIETEYEREISIDNFSIYRRNQT